MKLLIVVLVAAFTPIVSDRGGCDSVRRQLSRPARVEYRSIVQKNTTIDGRSTSERQKPTGQAIHISLLPSPTYRCTGGGVDVSRTFDHEFCYLTELADGRSADKKARLRSCGDTKSHTWMPSKVLRAVASGAPYADTFSDRFVYQASPQSPRVNNSVSHRWRLRLKRKANRSIRCGNVQVEIPVLYIDYVHEIDMQAHSEPAGTQFCKVEMNTTTTIRQHGVLVVIDDERNPLILKKQIRSNHRIRSVARAVGRFASKISPTTSDSTVQTDTTFEVLGFTNAGAALVVEAPDSRDRGKGDPKETSDKVGQYRWQVKGHTPGVAARIYAEAVVDSSPSELVKSLYEQIGSEDSSITGDNAREYYENYIRKHGRRIELIKIDGEKNTKTILKTDVHHSIAVALVHALNQSYQKVGFLPESIEGFEFRRAAAGTAVSRHSFGKAVDINSHSNVLRKDIVGLKSAGTAQEKKARYELLRKCYPDLIPCHVVQIFEANGLKWGGYCWDHIVDPMHFQL
jgi:D-alanyl-D-alanine carboxypeptidase-like protein